MHNFYQPQMMDTIKTEEKYLIHTDVYHLYYGQRLEFKQAVINNRDSAKLIFAEMLNYEYNTNTSIRSIRIDSFCVDVDSLYFRTYKDTIESIKKRNVEKNIPM